MTTYSAKPSEIQKDWIIVDAENMVLGRLASIIAMHLRGKHKPTFTPNMDGGDYVIVINAEKVALTGRNKAANSLFFWHTGYPGGIKHRSKGEILAGKYPERVIMKAVERMLPEGTMGRKCLTNLRVYKGAAHPHDAQQPKKLDVASMNRKNVRV